MSDDRVTGHFREQARFCVEYGSPFTGDLINRMADDVEANGPTAHAIGEWPTNPRADALALRLTGALHSASLTKRDHALHALHALYPAQNPNWRMDEIWPVARAFLERERVWVQSFITSPPQTNETRRAIALLAGFLAFAQHWKGPIDTLEIGASAGLNLNWDRFAYRTQTWSWGQGSPVVIDTDWNGAPPPLSPIAIRNRAACDLNPLDIRDEAARLQLKSYIWPDQADRLARFDGAVALALQHDTRVDRADAAEWLAQKLASRAQDAATIVYHSVFLQYPPREAREAIVNAIQEAGAKATSSAPIAWVRLEPEAVTDGIHNGLRFVVDLHTWPTGQRQILAYTDGHVRNVWSA